jgi:NAD(P)-dependent dehydrogenase (short-subunit alcohol dehydrogenase family)
MLQLPTHQQELSMSAQHAVIIGGSSGIGLAAAARLRALGLEVTVAGRDAAKLEAAAKAVAGVKTLTLDATDPAMLRDAFAGIGSADHLVLALGGNRGAGPLGSLTPDDFRAPFEDKVFPQAACIQAALPVLQPQGSITLVSAVSARAAFPGTAGLASANAAVEALVPVLAVELKPVRVNGVSPGVIDTGWWDWLSTEQKAAAFADFAGKTPVGRIGTADDVAAAIAFVVQNSFVTGHVLVCDGGLSLVA